jgi:hypothetical protein
MANDHQIPKSIINEMVIWVEDVLTASEQFKIKELKERFKPGEEPQIKVIAIDVEEQPIERPVENQEESYSGKKKRHTTKYQVMINMENKEILDIYNAVGKKHDFAMFKESMVGVLPKDISALMDSGYRGVQVYLPNALIPYKGSKSHPLTREEKAYNKLLSGYRIAIEHVNRELKIFRICKEVYRGKGARGLLRLRLIASLFNHRRIFSHAPSVPTAFA